MKVSDYYAPCKELDECNALIEQYWNTKRYELCFAGHLKLAEKGYPLAECQVGYFYLEGYGVQKNLTQAFYWTERAAQHGDRDAQFNLGWFYENGIIKKKNERKQEEKTMKFFIDTAKVEDIREANDMGVICGVTTNPSLIAKEGRDFNEVIKEITTIVDGPISGEVKATTTDAEGMIREGREIAAIHPNMVVKIPMTTEGLKAVKVLSSEGIKTNVTLIFSANQALLAARAGATYVSPFLGRLDDISTDGVELIQQIAEMFAVADIPTEIIAASVRHPMHVTACALAGADIATVPFKVIEQMTHHPLTDAGIAKFQADYKAVFGE